MRERRTAETSASRAGFASKAGLFLEHNGPAAESRIVEEEGGEKTMTEPRMVPRRSALERLSLGGRRGTDLEQAWNLREEGGGTGEKWTD